MLNPVECEGEVVPDAVLAILSPENKHVLLEQAARFSLQRRPEAEVILQNLQKLNPDLAKQFQHKEIALKELTFRMLCSTDAAISHDSNAHVHSFLIISYCWHNPSWKPAPAAYPSTNWGLSRPIVDKILDLRTSKDEGVWIDRHCIDQENAKEKIIAIGAMDVIYRAARRLLIVLEDVQLEDEENVAVKYSEMYQNMCRVIKESDPPSMAEKLKMIEELFAFDSDDLEDSKRFVLKVVNARWFSRAWCAHESKVNPHGKENNPLFLCFAKQGNVLDFEFRFIHYFATHIRNKHPEDFPQGGEYVDVLDGPAETNSLMRCAHTINGLMPDHNPDAYLMEYLVRMSDFECQEKSDLISISLNASRVPLMLKSAPGLPTSNESEANADRPELRYFLFALLSLASGDLKPLLLCARPLEIFDPSKNSNRVSWVDLPYNAGTQLRLPAQPNFTQYIHTATLEYIELDLYLITSQPKKASEASIAQAQSLIEKYSLGAINHISGVNEDGEATALAGDVMTEKGLNKIWLEEFLASSIDNGLAWMLRLPSILETQSYAGTWTYGTFDFTSAEISTALEAAAVELLSYFNIPVSITSQTESSTTTPTFISTYLHPTIHFLSALTDPRLPISVKVPRRLAISTPKSSNPSSSSDFAFTTSISDHSYIAIPVALAHLQFYESKAWVIEPGAEQWVPDWTWKVSVQEGGLKEEEKVHISEVFPVLAADMGDRRASWKEGEGECWTLRARQAVVGCGMIGEEGSGGAVRLLRRQRVYGGRDYDWRGMGEMGVKMGWPADWVGYVANES